MEFCVTKQHAHQSGSHFRLPEHFGGPIIQGTNQTHRIDAAQVSGSANFSVMWFSGEGPICISPEQTDTSVLLLDSSPRSSSTGCTDNLMGKHLRVYVSSNLLDSKSSETYGAISLRAHSHSSQMAMRTLIHRPTTTCNGYSKKTVTVVKFVTIIYDDQTFKSRTIQSTCLASIDRSFQEKGVSCESRKLLSASWRKGTQKDYTGKSNKFNCWCCEREIDPYFTSLTQVADFLTSLFDKGLQYRTLAGYRSMLPAV